MASMDLYGTPISAPCRMVQMTADVLGLKYNYKPINLMTGEQLQPAYLAINPQHTVPSLVDGDLILNESRAIITYLINQYAPDSALLPKDAKARALIEQMLFFDQGTFYSATIGNCVYPILLETGAVTEASKKRFGEVMGFVEDFVKGGKFIAGTDHLTIADISCLATMSTVDACGLFDSAKYPNVSAWYKKCKSKIPNYEKMCGEGAAGFGGWYKSKL